MLPKRTSIALAVMIGATAASGMTALAAEPTGGHAGHGAQTPRQAEVARLGAAVMPFDLDRSVHVFEPSPNGGMQTVISKDRDPAQIALIRDHLRKEAKAFARGDFSDPAAIHGDTMPGLAELRAGAGRIRVAYEDLPNGARLRYVAGEARLVEALHSWFAAQVSDHGAHATSR